MSKKQTRKEKMKEKESESSDKLASMAFGPVTIDI